MSYNLRTVLLLSAVFATVACDAEDSSDSERLVGDDSQDERAGDCPDACELLVGDLDDNGVVDEDDHDAMLEAVIEGIDICDEVGDVDGDGEFAIWDLLYLSQHIWSGGPAPVDPFPPGDVNTDGDVDITDYKNLYSWYSRATPDICEANADVNGDCTVNLTDLIYFGNWMWKAGPELQECTE